LSEGSKLEGPLRNI